MAIPPARKAFLENATIETVWNELERHTWRVVVVVCESKVQKDIPNFSTSLFRLSSSKKSFVFPGTDLGNESRQANERRTISVYGIPVFWCNCSKCVILEPWIGDRFERQA
jgi:hypothetical protein